MPKLAHPQREATRKRNGESKDRKDAGAMAPVRRGPEGRKAKPAKVKKSRGKTDENQ